MNGGVAILLVVIVGLVAGAIVLALYGSGSVGMHDTHDAGRGDERR